MRQMRRKEKEVDQSDALKILETGEYGVISTADSDGQPYGIPVNYCVIDNHIYFHCANEGHKIDNFTQNPKISFCVVGKTNILPEKFSTQYESVIVFGPIKEAVEDEKQAALVGLLEKYSSDYMKEGLEYIRKLNKKTRVFGIFIESMSGKIGK